MSMQSITTWTFKPDEPLELAASVADLEGTALLYSGGSLDSARNSFLCLHPTEKITGERCWQALQASLGAFQGDGLPIPKWVGYIGYEMGGVADPDKALSLPSSTFPDYCFYRPSVVIHFNHQQHRATLYANKEISLERSLPEAPKTDLRWVSSSDTFESYSEKIAQIKQLILEGEVYQVNLSQKLLFEGSISPYSLFENTVRDNPSPFSAYLNCSTFTVVSSSPERFLFREGRRLETRPIKGTTPRGKTPAEDAKNRLSLLSSEKERAELLMITDLMRNDLGKICDVGSVRTRDIWRTEAYTNVFHLLSIIEGACDANRNPVEIVRELFPGGSISGCPKLRAIDAIHRLEKRPRGVYTGSIGYFGWSGNFDLNIAIRTVVTSQNRVELQLGGAIVIDSDPRKEYEETLHKGSSLFRGMGLEDVCIH